ncbi:hypothetical protein AAY473_015758, partial [Plecturocebus cupreus]
MRSGVQDQPSQDGETPSLLKLQKLARHSGRSTQISHTHTQYPEVNSGIQQRKLTLPGHTMNAQAHLHARCGVTIRLPHTCRLLNNFNNDYSKSK